MQDSVNSILYLCKYIVYAVAFFTLLWDLNLAYNYIRMRTSDPSNFMYRDYVRGFYDRVDSFHKKPKRMILCEILLVIGILLLPPVFNLYANTDIGSILEKASYEECYYVYVREDMNEAKAYKLKADIVKGDYGYSSYTDEGEETIVIQGNGYFLEKVYWGNGGYLTFLDESDLLGGDSFGGIWLLSPSSRVYPNREVSVTDKQDKTYYVTLTKEKAK